MFGPAQRIPCRGPATDFDRDERDAQPKAVLIDPRKPAQEQGISQLKEVVWDRYDQNYLIFW